MICNSKLRSYESLVQRHKLEDKVLIAQRMGSVAETQGNKLFQLLEYFDYFLIPFNHESSSPNSLIFTNTLDMNIQC